MSAAMSSVLSGCVTAPFWPEGGKPEALPNYDKTSVEKNGCEGFTTLECVRKKLAEQHEDYASSRQQIHEYKNAANLSLFGLGGAAGVNAVTGGSKEGLQTLGLAAAGIVGLDGVLSADDQHATFGAGEEALRCVMLVDRKLDTTQESLLGTPPRTTGPRQISSDPLAPYLALIGEKYRVTAGVPIPNEAALLAQVGAAQSRLQEISSARLANAMPQLRLSDARPEVRAEHAANADAVFRAHERQRGILGAAGTAIRDAIDFRMRIAKISDDERADKLMDALNQIRKAVSDRLLFSHSDLSGIYGALKTAMQAAVKPPQAAAPPASGKAETASVLSTLTRGAGESDAELVSFRAALQIAHQDLETARDYASSLDACAAKAKPAPAPQEN